MQGIALGLCWMGWGRVDLFLILMFIIYSFNVAKMEGVMEKQIVPELQALEMADLVCVAGGTAGGAIPPWPPKTSQVEQVLSGGCCLPPWPPKERTKTNQAE